MRNASLLIKESLQARYLWIFAFCFATVTSLLFQKFLLPMLPSIHAGSGLLMNDAENFHKSAVLIADNVRAHGWSAWSIWSAQTSTGGNVAVLAALYAIFSVDPALIIPVNAFLQASSALLLLLIGRELWPGRVGNISGLVAAVFFVVFPSSLSWYSQPLKDCYVITGMLLILYTWLKAMHPLSVRGGVAALLAWMWLGTLLVAFVKLYYLRLLLVAAGLSACVVAFHFLWIKHPQRYRIMFFYFSAFVLIAATFQVIRPLAVDDGQGYAEWMPTAGAGTTQAWQWQDSPWLPDTLERYLETTAKTRAGMIEHNYRVGAGSIIDTARAPQSSSEMLMYLPRALQIALFAPFPDTWLQKPSLIRLISVCETLLWYCIAPGLLLALYYRRTLALALTLIFAVFFMTVFSFVTPNVGTLYRYRYVYEFMLMVIALGGWVQFFLNHPGRKKRQSAAERAPEDSAPAENNNPTQHSDTKRNLIGAAATVSLLTLIGSLGFFARDLFMIRWFGAGNEMDNFFLGAMIPMFFVSVLSIPAGTAMTPVFSVLQNASDRLAQARVIGSAVIFLSLLLALVSILLHFLAPYLFSMMSWHYTSEKMATILGVMNIYLIILLLSGLVVTANAVLNTEGIAVFPAAAQLIVPVVVLLALLMFGSAYGINAAAYGMLAGQIMNLALVIYALRRWVPLPSFRPDISTAFQKLPFRQYFILVAASLSAALFVPVANAIAANLPSGSVAIIGLGSKVILLITGVVGIGMTTVLLPYFSSLVAKFHHHQAKSDLSFFLLFVTLLSVPAALILTVLAEFVTGAVFENSALNEADIQNVVKVIQYGVIQLPFFTCGLVAIKFITAYQRTWVILLSSLVGLILTVILGVFLAKLFGVGGISMAMTLAMVVSTAILVSYANHLKHLPVSDSVFIVFNWAIFITLFICLHYRVYVGAVICGSAYLLLVAGSWQAMIAHAYGGKISLRYRSKVS